MGRLGIVMRIIRRAAAPLAWLLPADRWPPEGLAVLDRETMVPAPLPETFAFFADAANLARLTPPWLGFTVVTRPPVVIRHGAEIDYVINVFGLPVPWRTRIDVWEPGVRFVDRQIAGPYRWWRHEHRFEAVAGGTRVVDRVEYLPRFAWLTAARVARDLDQIFTYREQALREIFSSRRSS